MPYADKAKQSQYQNERNKRIRREWFAAQGGKCVLCGSGERLECDHIDRATKPGPDAHKVWSWSKARMDVELAKCQVLCHDCHLTKTMAENQVDPRCRRDYERQIYVGAAA